MFPEEKVRKYILMMVARMGKTAVGPECERAKGKKPQLVDSC